MIRRGFKWSTLQANWHGFRRANKANGEAATTGAPPRNRPRFPFSLPSLQVPPSPDHLLDLATTLLKTRHSFSPHLHRAERHYREAVDSALAAGLRDGRLSVTPGPHLDAAVWEGAVRAVRCAYDQQRLWGTPHLQAHLETHAGTVLASDERAGGASYLMTQRHLPTHEDMIFLAFRGTADRADAMIDANFDPVFPDFCDQGQFGVHGGFVGALLQSLPRLRRALARHCPSQRRLVITGHSLGAGYAQVLHALLQREGFPVHRVVLFGSAHTFCLPDETRATGRLPPTMAILGSRTDHLINRCDIVPRLGGPMPRDVVALLERVEGINTHALRNFVHVGRVHLLADDLATGRRALVTMAGEAERAESGLQVLPPLPYVPFMIRDHMLAEYEEALASMHTWRCGVPWQAGKVETPLQ